jgi:hypothetical protein
MIPYCSPASSKQTTIQPTFVGILGARIRRRVASLRQIGHGFTLGGFGEAYTSIALKPACKAAARMRASNVAT